MASAKGIQSAQYESGIQPGKLVLYENDGVPIIGAVLSAKKDKYIVLNDRGREIELAGSRLYELPGKMPGSCVTLDARSEFLESTREEGVRFAAGIDLEEIWTFVHEEQQDFSNRQLCELYFGNNDLIPHLGLRLALLSDTTYFKRTKETFSVRPEEVIEELKRAQATRDKKELTQKLAVEFVGLRLKDKSAPVPPELQNLISSVADLAALAPELDHAHQREAIELIEHACQAHSLSLTGQPEHRAYELLLRIGVFTRRTNPRVIRHKPPTDFPPEALSESESITVPSALEGYGEEEISRRRDFTGIRCITIDDSTTRDMDDALSLEEGPWGFTLYVHISDVASFLPRDTALDRETIRRGTSLYLPEQKIHMLPPSLSENHFSLVEGSVRPAITCIFSVNRSFEVTNSEIVPSLVKVSERFDYNEVDEAILRGVHEFDLLHQIASTREMQRISNGGFKVHKRDIVLHVEENCHVTLQEVDEDSPARSMIGEMMILANECIAKFCHEKGLAVPFRGQEHSDPDDGALSRIPAGPAYDFAIKTRLKRSETSFDPVSHASLGLDFYTQATSPIRRFLDLGVQRQLISFFRSGKPCYSREEFETINAAVQDSLATAGSVSRESKRYWIFRYLEGLAKSGRRIGGTVVRTEMKNPLVELDEVFIAVPARISGEFKLGDYMQFKLNIVDSLGDYIRIEAAR